MLPSLSLLFWVVKMCGVYLADTSRKQSLQCKMLATHPLHYLTCVFVDQCFTEATPFSLHVTLFLILLLWSKTFDCPSTKCFAQHQTVAFGGADAGLAVCRSKCISGTDFARVTCTYLCNKNGNQRQRTSGFSTYFLAVFVSVVTIEMP